MPLSKRRSGTVGCRGGGLTLRLRPHCKPAEMQSAQTTLLNPFPPCICLGDVLLSSAKAGSKLTFSPTPFSDETITLLTIAHATKHTFPTYVVFKNYLSTMHSVPLVCVYVVVAVFCFAAVDFLCLVQHCPSPSRPFIPLCKRVRTIIAHGTSDIFRLISAWLSVQVAEAGAAAAGAAAAAATLALPELQGQPAARRQTGREAGFHNVPCYPPQGSSSTIGPRAQKERPRK